MQRAEQEYEDEELDHEAIGPEFETSLLDKIDELIAVLREAEESGRPEAVEGLKKEVYDDLWVKMTDLFRQLQEARADSAEKDALIETLRVRLQRMINCAHSSTETAQDCVQRIEDAAEESRTLRQLLLRMQRENASLRSRLRMAKEVGTDDSDALLKKYKEHEQKQAELDKQIAQVEGRNRRLEQLLQERTTELEQARAQAYEMMSYLGEVREAVLDVKRRELRYRQLYMQAQDENATLRVTVNALRYPVAGPPMAAPAPDMPQQNELLHSQPNSQLTATPPPSSRMEHDPFSPNSAEDDRFFTPHSTRRPHRRASPSSPMEEIPVRQLPNPLAIPRVDENTRDGNAERIQPVSTPTHSRDKPGFWNRVRELFSEPDAEPDVLETPRATRQPAIPPHSVTFSSDGEVTVFSPAREPRYHATPQVLGKADLDDSPATEGDESSQEEPAA